MLNDGSSPFIQNVKAEIIRIISKRQKEVMLKINTFSEKRKKISNNLKKNYSIDKLTKAYVKFNIQEDVRAEQLTPEQIVSLYEELK